MLSEEETIQAITDIESNQNLRNFIFHHLSTNKTVLTRLSNRKILNLEHLSKLIIEFVGSSELEMYNSKRSSLANFVSKHPWIKVDNNKIFDSLLPWLQLYNKAANLGENQYLCITRAGEIDIITIE